MPLPARALVLALTAMGVLAADIATKAAPFGKVIAHHTTVSPVLLLVLALGIVGVGLSYSVAIAFGAGLMLGGLVGNGGEILLRGYATDWIPVGDWRTNLADVAATLGLVCCCAGYAYVLRSRSARTRQGGEKA